MPAGALEIGLIGRLHGDRSWEPENRLLDVDLDDFDATLAHRRRPRAAEHRLRSPLTTSMGERPVMTSSWRRGSPEKPVILVFGRQ
jgi:hypothetical protein